jgi:hypothetical protein
VPSTELLCVESNDYACTRGLDIAEFLHHTRVTVKEGCTRLAIVRIMLFKLPAWMDVRSDCFVSFREVLRLYRIFYAFEDTKQTNPYGSSVRYPFLYLH